MKLEKYWKNLAVADGESRSGVFGVRSAFANGVLEKIERVKVRGVTDSKAAPMSGAPDEPETEGEIIENEVAEGITLADLENSEVEPTPYDFEPLSVETYSFAGLPTPDEPENSELVLFYDEGDIHTNL